MTDEALLSLRRLYHAALVWWWLTARGCDLSLWRCLVEYRRPSAAKWGR